MACPVTIALLGGRYLTGSSFDPPASACLLGATLQAPPGPPSRSSLCRLSMVLLACDLCLSPFFWSSLSLPLALRKVKVYPETHRYVCVRAAGYMDVGIELECKYSAHSSLQATGRCARDSQLSAAHLDLPVQPGDAAWTSTEASPFHVFRGLGCWCLKIAGPRSLERSEKAVPAVGDACALSSAGSRRVL